MKKAELIYDARATLGEGPVWDHSRDLLIWVDIEEGRIHLYNPNSGSGEYLAVYKRIGMVVPNTEGHLIAALQDGFAWIPEEGPPVFVTDPEEEMDQNRFNDGKCDPQGRLWAGTMHLEAKEKSGSLYCMKEDLSVTRILTNIGISNGLAWTEDSKTMYFIDTSARSVQSYDFHPESGEISNPVSVIKIPEKHGAPDGMTIDTEGKLWIAHWGGGNVSRWDPETGNVIEIIEVPAPQPTSCTFGGSGLDTLFITTARIGMSDRELTDYPESGGVFACKPGVRGFKASFFKGEMP